MKIFLATGNINKIKEMKKILSNLKDTEILSIRDGIEIPEIEEDGKTFEENSIKKAVCIAKYLNIMTIADDSGLCVDALNGAPGVYSARYAGSHGNDEDNNKKLINELKNEKDRRAKYVCVITLAKPNGEHYSYYGETYGTIIDTPKGDNGFGYDPYFYVDKYKKTMAEISEEEKNSISHRGIALRALEKDIVKISEG